MYIKYTVHDQSLELIFVQIKYSSNFEKAKYIIFVNNNKKQIACSTINMNILRN